MKEKLIKESEVDKLIEDIQMAIDRHTASSPTIEKYVDMTLFTPGLLIAEEVIKKEYREWKESLEGKKTSHE